MVALYQYSRSICILGLIYKSHMIPLTVSTQFKRNEVTMLTSRLVTFLIVSPVLCVALCCAVFICASGFEHPSQVLAFVLPVDYVGRRFTLQWTVYLRLLALGRLFILPTALLNDRFFR